MNRRLEEAFEKAEEELFKAKCAVVEAENTLIHCIQLRKDSRSRLARAEDNLEALEDENAGR